MRPVALKCRLIQPDAPPEEPEEVSLEEPEDPGVVEELPEEPEVSPEDCACAPSTKHAAQNTMVLTICCFITCLSCFVTDCVSQ
jgi:hypothetical protein